MPIGRPSSYTQETADEICRRLSEGESLRAICREPAMPSHSTVFRWIEDLASFREQYMRARERQAHVVAEQALDEATQADDAAKGRLAFDARRWYAGKLLPKVYGDKTLHANDSGDGPPVVVVKRLFVPPGDE